MPTYVGRIWGTMRDLSLILGGFIRTHCGCIAYVKIRFFTFFLFAIQENDKHKRKHVKASTIDYFAYLINKIR